MTLYDPQTDGAPPPFNSSLPVSDPSGNDQFNSAINWTRWQSWANRSPAAMAAPGDIIDTWKSIAAQLASSSAQGQLVAIANELRPFAEAGTPPPQELADRLQALGNRIQAQYGHPVTTPPDTKTRRKARH